MRKRQLKVDSRDTFSTVSQADFRALLLSNADRSKFERSTLQLSRKPSCSPSALQHSYQHLGNNHTPCQFQHHSTDPPPPPPAASAKKHLDRRRRRRSRPVKLASTRKVSPPPQPTNSPTPLSTRQPPTDISTSSGTSSLIPRARKCGGYDRLGSGHAAVRLRDGRIGTLLDRGIWCEREA